MQRAIAEAQDRRVNVIIEDTHRDLATTFRAMQMYADSGYRTEFHVEQLRYVVVELKIGRFKPDYTGQLGFYVAVVDDKLRQPEIHSPTVGILLCANRSDAVVRYALANTTAPMAVANYTAQPAEVDQLSLPSPDELEAILTAPLAGHPGTTLGDALPDDGHD